MTTIYDKNKKQVTRGVIIAFPYVSPVGKIINPDEADSTYEVLYKYGSLGIETELAFIPLFSFMKKEEGEYIPNKGCRKKYTNEYPFWVVDSHKEDI